MGYHGLRNVITMNGTTVYYWISWVEECDYNESNYSILWDCVSWVEECDYNESNYSILWDIMG